MSDQLVSDGFTPDPLTPDVTGGGSGFSPVSSVGGRSHPVAAGLDVDLDDGLDDGLLATQPMDLTEIFRAPKHSAIYLPVLARSIVPAEAPPAAPTRRLL